MEVFACVCVRRQCDVGLFLAIAAVVAMQGVSDGGSVVAMLLS